jgi:energy-converting hydrogenase A subunit M
VTDHPLPEDDAIAAAHPMRTGKHDTYQEANRLVSAKHSKGALVELVNWLLVERDALKKELAIEQSEFDAVLSDRDTADSLVKEWHSRFEQAKEHADALLQQNIGLGKDRDEIQRERDGLAAAGKTMAAALKEEVAIRERVERERDEQHEADLRDGANMFHIGKEAGWEKCIDAALARFLQMAKDGTDVHPYVFREIRHLKMPKEVA